MTTLEPRPPYTAEELRQLYPQGLQLQLVQVLLRHGERSPVSARFQNAGLKPYWPYCNTARFLTSVIKTPQGWDRLNYRRRLESFGANDNAVVVTGPKGEYDGVCLPGELTDKGRETTMALGQRLRHLYVDQLGFMPSLISDSDMMYLRASPMPRALESVQQAFTGLYPSSARTADFPPPTILTRTPADETLFPNEGGCRRLRQLTRAFAQRTADRWNDHDDMKYLNQVLGKWMPPSSPTIAVDGHPRLSGIMDTTNSTLAHGPDTRLPKEFYGERVRTIIDRFVVEEWFSGYQESREYRRLGIGALVGDIVTRMVGSVEQDAGLDGLREVSGNVGRGGEHGIKFGLSGCHDTTLAGILAGLGAYEGEAWPPYTSHVAVELFRKPQPAPMPGSVEKTLSEKQQDGKPGWWALLFGAFSKPEGSTMDRRPIDQLSDKQREKLKGYYVRVRYNDKVMKVPGCKKPGDHLEGDDSFCTLEAFKAIADQFTPRNWHQECLENLDKPTFPERTEPAGYR